MLINSINYTPPEGIELHIVEALLNDALSAAKSLEEAERADVFLSAGANLATIAPHLKTPVVGISVTGFDLLLALTKVQNCRVVGVVSYMEKIPYIESIQDVLSTKLLQEKFVDVNDLDVALNSLRRQNINTVLGGSLVVERARLRGMQGIFIYSEDGVQRAIDTAIKVGVTKQREAERAEQLATILNFAHEGIIATDRHGVVTAFNPSAEKISHIPRRAVIGRLAKDCVPGTHLHDILTLGKPELNQIQVFDRTKVLTNRVPIITQGEITGAVATFQNVDVIQEAERKIRMRLSARGFVAKSQFTDIVHRSRFMEDLIKESKLYAKTDSTIAILGESGTGKEIFAQAIHNESNRCENPFVTINCAALPPSLLESELFGYDEGAFTGAKKGGRTGLFELGHGGSIFLDEIGELPKAIQSRLLRVLQEHEVLRVGGDRVVPVNIRIISATNKNLWEMVKSGRFRQDLYYRLCVLELHIPRLAERYEDIPLLVGKFLRQFRKDLPPPIVKTISEHPLFRRCPWPGNIRELHNIIERVAVLYRPETDINKLVRQVLESREEGSVRKRDLGKIHQIMGGLNGNRTKAAKQLGISRTTLWRRLRKSDHSSSQLT